MKLKDLQQGMIVELRGKEKYIYLDNFKILGFEEPVLGLLDGNGIYLHIDGYNDDLTDDTMESLDIMKVYRPDGTNFSSNQNLKLIWERKERDYGCEFCNPLPSEKNCKNCHYGQKDNEENSYVCNRCIAGCDKNGNIISEPTDWTPINDNFCRKCGRKLN